MADRVHPRDSPNPTKPTQAPPENLSVQPKPDIPTSSSKPNPPPPPPGTYVVQIPKDQIYRYPPPENARRYARHQSHRRRRSSCCCCCCWILGLLTILIILTAIAGAVFYLIYHPQAPKYSVEKISITGFNLTSSSSSSTTSLNLSPSFNVTVRAENPNDKIGIHYKKGSSVTVSHSDEKLCDGVIPAFYQTTNNVTIFNTVLTSHGIVLTVTQVKKLTEEQNKKAVLLKLHLKVPVKIKVGSVKTWKITVKVNCDITVNSLTVNASIVSKKCSVHVNPFDF